MSCVRVVEIDSRRMGGLDGHDGFQTRLLVSSLKFGAASGSYSPNPRQFIVVVNSALMLCYFQDWEVFYMEVFPE